MDINIEDIHFTDITSNADHPQKKTNDLNLIAIKIGQIRRQRPCNWSNYYNE